MAEPRDRYSTVSLLLHWGIAALILTNILLVEQAEEAERSARGFWMMLHKSVGISILLLTLARIGWRVVNPAIPLPDSVPGWQRFGARAIHVALYALLLGIPLAGWASGSAAGRDLILFNVVPWFNLPLPQDRDLAKDIIEVHELLVKALYGLVALHVAAALKHQFIDRDGVMRRMLPFLPAPTPRNEAS